MFVILLVCVSALTIGYTLILFAYGSRPVIDLRQRPASMRFVVMIPCLDEELVIGRSIERLLAIDDDDLVILVIDDGSSDRTAEIVSSYRSEQVHLFQRVAPNCRKGKGEALNAAYRYVREETERYGLDPHRVVLAVLDADGRLDPHAIDKVAPCFADPAIGAVQIKVRIHNAPDATLARLQDYEFATFTEVFQRARARLGSSGLGGNGQFTRLSSLMDLGDSPWTDCLTEDLELGINLLLRGHRNDFVPSAWVSQQGVTSWRPLVRQRSRWFQGHLQCLRMVLPVLRSDLRPIAKFDLCFHLLNSVAMLLFQTVSLWFLAMIGWWALTSPTQTFTTFTSGLTPAFVYLFAFGLVPLATFAYLRTEPDLSVAKAMGFSHLYVLYTYMWWLAGWRAVYRQLVGATSWAKTARTVGTGDEAPVTAATPLWRDVVGSDVGGSQVVRPQLALVDVVHAEQAA